MHILAEKINRKILSLNTPAHPDGLYQPVSYTLDLGGKRMRPLLTLLGYSLFKEDNERALDAAVAIELFHNFTLLHDDIMDKAPLRRGKPTVWQKWGSNTATLSGDVMLIMAYERLSEYEPVILKTIQPIFNRTATKVCEGQQMDMNFETRQQVSIAEYVQMIEYKTAVLLGAALQIGALIAGANEEDAQNLYEFGKNTGLAFQLHDDILDVFGDAEKFGKKVGGDIIANKKTFLLLKAFELADEKTTIRLKDLLLEKNEDRKVEGVKKIYDQLEVRNLAEAEMQHYYTQGVWFFNKVNAPAEKKKMLSDFTEQLMQREK